MIRITRETNNSETAFIIPEKTDEYDVEVRYFTPAEEDPICGYATIAAHYIRAKRLGLKSSRVLARTKAGILPVDITVAMTQSRAILLEPFDKILEQQLLTALNISKEDLLPEYPVQVV
ncbi:hypothetical protein FC82_GL003128 [Secundilactobacillus collinoides DSM 20515 = JCM 1123]|uniref:Uncharacterized protein n=1 Tax=Secundilactobacillus collinoides DSM 20515 = JCM 1123 TaxID=1423733 RepID=A0A0R2BEH3_SECCO|nr:hypothetical protein FC82_GL003128 [Secundilactobacillus collinoides DSM 20515 = JCM 1123]